MTVFQIVCEHETDFGVCARWNYLETGHGKGPCDGLGASVKRMADLAVKQHKCLIQDASDFFKWTLKRADETKVKYIQYTEQNIEEASETLKLKKQAIPIQGTMKIHAVCPTGQNSIAVREMSCYCDDCTNNVTTSVCGWNIKPITKARGVNSTSTLEEQTNGNQEEVENQPKENLKLNKEDWVAAIYDGHWFIGQVTEVDDDDCQINFLTKAGNYGKIYKFPLQKDEIWVTKTDILLILNDIQEVVGKTRKTYKLSVAEEQLIEKEFNKKK